ncbi:MAG: DUF664 domain-containing protein [Nocardioidaceae bacterium]|nr:DUF664 domain-containing protein [Nocardioidaceae bacterium]
MTDPTLRTDPPAVGSEAEQLRAFLDFHRATLQQKTAGLDAAGLAATLPPSTMTLGGLLKHMALVEENWFSYFFHDHPMGEPWASVPWDDDPDWEWRTAADDDPDDLRARHAAAAQRSRDLVAGVDLDRLSARRLRGSDERTTLRWIMLHMVEEYARHNGHADLLRESVDGSVGE